MHQPYHLQTVVEVHALQRARIILVHHLLLRGGRLFHGNGSVGVVVLASSVPAFTTPFTALGVMEER